MRLPLTPSARKLPLGWPSARRIGILIAMLTLAMIPGDGNALLQNSPPNNPRNVPEFINRQPDFGDQERMRQEQSSQQGFAAINALRKKQVTDDSTKLLKLASDLKDEVDKSEKDTVSQGTLRKAEAIEKLARSIKQKMTVTPLTN